MMDKVTVNSMVKNLQEGDLEISDQLNIFISLIHDETLMNHFKKKALLIQMEMDTNDSVYDFAWGILNIAKPHLFIEET